MKFSLEYKKKIEKLLLDMFASSHLVNVEKPLTSNEKISRYFLEKEGYIDKARDRLGGEYKESSSQEFIDELAEYVKEQEKHADYGK